MVEFPAKERYTPQDLVEIIAILRDPQQGCPWDRVQTHASIRQNFLEETYEALEAIDTGNTALLQEELGDVLMQVLLHAQMEAECGHFDFNDVCNAVSQKLIYRHPHIFSCSPARAALEETEISSPQASLDAWETLKNMEKGRKSLADELESVPITFTALMKAQKLLKRTAAFAPQWNDGPQALAALRTAQEAFAAQPTQQNAGELLLAATNCVRLAGLDAEESLELSAKAFAQKALAAENGQAPK